MAVTPRLESPAPPAPALPEDNSDANRIATDNSLRVERHTADGARTRAVEEDADRVVDLARARADAIVVDARQKADGAPSDPERPADLTRDRAEADGILEDERAAADE